MFNGDARLDPAARTVYGVLVTRRPLSIIVAPVVAGLVAGGVLAFLLGWADAALVALVVGLAASALTAVLVVLYAVALAVAALFRSVAVLWRAVADMGTWLDLDGDVAQDVASDALVTASAPEGSVVYDGTDEVGDALGWAFKRNRKQKG